MQSNSKTNDDILIDRLKKGDKKALTELYNTYWKPLFISSYNLLKDNELCEEIIQDVFIDLWNSREKIQIKISINSYLYACTRYKVFSQFRKNKIIRVELFEDLNKRFQYATPETKLMHQELVEQIDAIVETLPQRCKQVYKLSRGEQLSHKEIAEQLNISTKTVENHITNALKILKMSLGHSFSIEILYLISQNLN
ncbi:RNA polymerase sigma factor [Flavivirga spongiicola]|uniref:RNA polymerase sigma-70 factor n=1 Tax=Flavivirga spongiicola TaxID=421621 RepID=A0ABU7XPW8_9FLAO|nr:RNA polymerase sigma-70 factor [Flavivirga sp. MEBiC05379]MDO5977829.1 RNA polymerase sigma-70 factor [Flavivirga sp. MEBiC05379]